MQKKANSGQGNGHWKATLSAVEIDRMRELAESTPTRRGANYRELAEWFGVSYDTVKAICTCRRRAYGHARVNQYR